MNKENTHKNYFILGTEEIDKANGLTQTVKYMATPKGAIVLVNTKQKDSSGKYSISESSIEISDVAVEILNVPKIEGNITVYAILLSTIGNSGSFHG